MNATLDLQLLGHGTYLTAAGEPPVRVTLGFDEVVQQHFLKPVPLDYGIEMAIAAIEDELECASMKVAGNKVSSTSPEVINIARVCGLSPAAELHRDAVENLFNRQVTDALSRPAAMQEQEAAVFLASLLLLRELMHHLGIDSVQV